MIISLDAKNAFDKIGHPFMLKVLERSRIQGTYLNIIKSNTLSQKYSRPTDSIKLNREKLKAIPVKSETDKVGHSLLIYSIFYLKF